MYNFLMFEWMKGGGEGFQFMGLATPMFVHGNGYIRACVSMRNLETQAKKLLVIDAAAPFS